METTIIAELGSFTLNDKVSHNELIERIEQLELKKAQCKLAAQETLLKCEAKYQAMLESVDDYIIMVDRNSMILWANGKAKKMFGRDIVGKSCCEALYGKKELCGDESSCMTQHAFRNDSTVKRHSLKMTIRDGSERYFVGYPYNLQKDEILLEARIIGVADVIEAMSSHRPYRPALGIDDAFEEITMNRGITYDPDVVDASIDLFTKRGSQFN